MARSGVLHVAGGVGQDERPPRRGEVAVGDVDGDALLALGAQAVGQQREVDVVALARPGDRLVLVLEDRLAVVQQPADEGALAVVHRPGGGDADDVLARRGDLGGVLGDRRVDVDGVGAGLGGGGGAVGGSHQK
jgi:hypothetical protein